MTEPSSRYESVVDQQIRMARERGDFDNLPGMGKPLPSRGRHDDDLWWVKDFLRREELSADALLPTSLQLAKEVERLPEAVRRLPSEQVVREVVGNLNQRVVEYLRMPSGPYVPLAPVDADDVVQQWRAVWLAPTDPSDQAATPERAATVRGSTRWGRWLGRRRKCLT